MGGNVRKAVAEGRGDCIPIFLHEIPQLFYKKIVKPDIAVIQVRQLCLYCLNFGKDNNEKQPKAIVFGLFCKKMCSVDSYSLIT